MSSNMGNGYGIPFTLFGRSSDSKVYPASLSSSSSSSDEEECSAEELVDSNLNIKRYRNGINKFSTHTTLTLDVVAKLERDLDFDDSISMVFLLYESNLALDTIFPILSAGPYNFSRDLLSKWAHTKPRNYSIALIEALCVIQNYTVLNKLGFRKAETENHFKPQNNFTLHLNKAKKVLYLLCESLSKDQTNKLIELVRQDAKFQNDITANHNWASLEFFILFWISRNYITVDKEISLKNLTKHLKQMDLLDKVEELDNVVNIINSERNPLPLTHLEDSDAYPIIDPENVGVCVIVNMAEFTQNVEKRKEYQHLLPNIPLDDRHGSLMDVKNLKNTFTHLKFTVVEIHDVFHYDLERKIQCIIRDNFKPKVHSVLILCILSHGDKGVVYASNSIPVTIQSIQNIVSGPSPIEDLLGNIPKVIMIQACQGQDALFVEQKTDSKEGRQPSKYNQLNLDGSTVNVGGTESLKFDGPQFTPKYADVMTCFAIIEGFVAVRSTKEGTKYVQEFCNCLKQYYKKDHLLDIVTKVHNNLNSKWMHVTTDLKELWNCTEHPHCTCMYMTPEVKHTLRKKLYLTPFRI